MRCAFSSTDLRVAGAAGAPHDAWLSLVSAIYKAICKTLKTIKSKAHNQLCQHWELRGILKPSPCVADEGRLNTLNKQLGTELIPQSSGARDTGRFFLSPAFKCKSLSPEAHSALFFYMKITALWSCSREDTIHPRKGSEDKQAPHPVSCRQVLPAFVGLATPLVIEIPREEWEFGFQVIRGYTHIAMLVVQAKHQREDSAPLAFQTTLTIDWKLSKSH